MLILLMSDFIHTVLSTILGLFGLEVVTELPSGMQNALNVFVGTIYSLAEHLVWMQIPLVLILTALFIEFSFMAIGMLRWVLQLIRG